MLVIIDYGVGNLFSLSRSLDFLKVENKISSKKEDLLLADRIILPGVGAFADAAKKLEESGIKEALLEKVDAGTPLLGICLGMQLLFEKSMEYGQHKGLGLLKGTAASIADDFEKAGITGLKVPHMGWNSLEFTKEVPLFKNTKPGDFVYFVHSFYGKDCGTDTAATTHHGITLTAAVARDNVMGTQFHPEKSGEVGLRILSTFSTL